MGAISYLLFITGGLRSDGGGGKSYDTNSTIHDFVAPTFLRMHIFLFQRKNWHELLLFIG